MHDSRKRLFAGALIVVAGLGVALAFRKPVTTQAPPPLTSPGFTEVAPTGPITGPHIAVEPARPRLTGRIETAVPDVATPPDFSRFSAGPSNGTIGLLAAPGSTSIPSVPGPASTGETSLPVMASTLDAAKAADVATGPATPTLSELPKVAAQPVYDSALKPLTELGSWANLAAPSHAAQSPPPIGSSALTTPLLPAVPETGLPRLRDTFAASADDRFRSPIGSNSSPATMQPSAVAFGTPSTNAVAAELARQEQPAWKPRQAALPDPPRGDLPSPLQLLKPPSTEVVPSSPSNPGSFNALPNSANVAGQRFPMGDTTRPIPIDRGRHRIVDGDTLESLARQYYGDPNRAGDIFTANRGLLRSPDLLPIGSELVIPDSGANTRTGSIVPPSASEIPRTSTSQFASYAPNPSNVVVPTTQNTPLGTMMTQPRSPTFVAPSAPAGWPAALSGQAAASTNDNVAGNSSIQNPGNAAIPFGGFPSATGTQAGWPPKGVENGVSEGNAFTRGLTTTGQSLARFGNAVLGAENSASETTGRSYLVRPLESWESLAQRYYGDATKASLLRAANPALANSSLKPGSVVIVPAK